LCPNLYGFPLPPLSPLLDVPRRRLMEGQCVGVCGLPMVNKQVRCASLFDATKRDPRLVAPKPSLFSLSLRFDLAYIYIEAGERGVDSSSHTALAVILVTLASLLIKMRPKLTGYLGKLSRRGIQTPSSCLFKRLGNAGEAKIILQFAFRDRSASIQGPVACRIVNFGGHPVGPVNPSTDGYWCTR
jgi:hypothetical protein